MYSPNIKKKRRIEEERERERERERLEGGKGAKLQQHCLSRALGSITLPLSSIPLPTHSPLPLSQRLSLAYHVRLISRRAIMLKPMLVLQRRRVVHRVDAERGKDLG